MTKLNRPLLALLLLVAGPSLMPLAASAGDPQIEAAQAEGVVGERLDGYLGIVTANADAALVRKVNEINNKRRALFDQTAKDTGTTTAQVARISGEKQIARAAIGEFVMLDTGLWTQKIE